MITKQNGSLFPAMKKVLYGVTSRHLIKMKYMHRSPSRNRPVDLRSSVIIAKLWSMASSELVKFIRRPL